MNRRNRLPTAIHVIAKLELGGAQRIAIETARRLRGYRNILVAGTEGLLVEEALHLESVETRLLASLERRIDPFSDIASFLQIGRIISREVVRGAEVTVHSHGSKAGVLTRLAARRAGAHCVVHTIHGFAFHRYQPRVLRLFYILLERFCAKYCDALIAVSRATARKGLAERIGRPRQYFVINPAILESHLRESSVDVRQKRRELGIDEDSLVVGTVSCFKPQKAPLDFVEVARIVHEDLPAVQFVMVGGGVLAKAAEESILKNGLEGVFHLLGWREDVPEIISVFDVFLLTSLWEGLPMVHAEAMARAKPIVATSVDGTPEVVLDGVNGFLAPAGDVKRMAERVTLLLGDTGLRTKMGKTGKSMVSPRFTMDRLVRDVASLYQNLLSRP
jgi:glycosyltransferase involved in cell wall biosynthesis